MKRSAVWFFVALGLSFGFQDVRAQETEPVDLHPPYLAEEELAVPEGEEIPVLEKGEGDGVTERGIRKFKIPRIKPKPKIKKGFRVPKGFKFPQAKKSKPKFRIPRGKRPKGAGSRKEQPRSPRFIPNQVIVKLRPGMALPSSMMKKF